MRFDHRQRVALTIGKQLASQFLGLPGFGDRAGGQAQEGAGRGHPVSDTVQVVVAERRAQSRGDRFDRIAEFELWEVDRASDDRQ